MVSYPEDRSEVLFSLIPINEDAKLVVADPKNKDRVTFLDLGQYAIDVGYWCDSEAKSMFTLATLGREADITVRVTPDGHKKNAISRRHCSFEFNRYSGVVMLYDRSHAQSTVMRGPNPTNFENPRPRKIVIGPGINSRFSFGGEAGYLFIFEIVWHMGWEEIRAACEKLEKKDRKHEPDPATALTSTATPLNIEINTRYVKSYCLGAGAFGTVWKALDLDTGN